MWDLASGVCDRNNLVVLSHLNLLKQVPSSGLAHRLRSTRLQATFSERGVEEVWKMLEHAKLWNTCGFLACNISLAVTFRYNDCHLGST